MFMQSFIFEPDSHLFFVCIRLTKSKKRLVRNSILCTSSQRDCPYFFFDSALTKKMSSRKSSRSSYSIPSVSSSNKSVRSKAKSSTSKSGFSNISWDDSNTSRSIGNDFLDARSWDEAELDSILAREPTGSSTPTARFVGPGRRRVTGAAFTPRSASPKSKAKRSSTRTSPYYRKRIPATEPKLRVTTQRRFSNRTSVSRTPLVFKSHPSPGVKTVKRTRIGNGRQLAIPKILDEYDRLGMNEQNPRKHIMASGIHLRTQKKVFLIPLDDLGKHPTAVGVLVVGQRSDDDAIRGAKSIGWHSHIPIKFLLLKPAFRSKRDKSLGGQKVPDALITRASIVTMDRGMKKHTTRSRRDLSFHVFQSLTHRLQ